MSEDINENKQRMVGRSKELLELRKILDADQSAFVALYGRRRVGKTFLIRHAFHNRFDFYVTGVARADTRYQLANFNNALAQFGGETANTASSKDWFSAFQQLIHLLERKEPAKKKVIFLDELPWMDTPKSKFISALEHFWNSWASARNDILLIVCGSATSWMLNQLIKNTGGLYHRITHRMQLLPFSLKECEHFLKNKGSAFDRYQILLLFMVMGGIPFYLEQVNVAESAAQNINRLCFQENGLLKFEFDTLFKSLFKKSEKHEAVVEALGRKTKGLTRAEIISAAGLTEGGGTSRLLKELEESQFITRYTAFGKSERSSLYQLRDCYSLFYLKCVKNTNVFDENNWIHQLDSPSQRAWSGYAFEQVCLLHLKQIKKALGISGIQTQTASWIGRNEESGAQIDLVINRKDHVINLCEMKFSIHRFTITKKYAEELRNKLSVFRTETKTNKALFLTLISTFGLEKNSYSYLAQNELTADVLFED